MTRCPHCRAPGEITGTYTGPRGPELIGWVCRRCPADWATVIDGDTKPLMLLAAGIADMRRAEKGPRFAA